MDAIRKSVYAAVGFAMMGADKVREAGRKIARDAKMNENEGRQYVDELVCKSRATRKNIEHYVVEMVTATLKKMNVPTQKQMDDLQRRVAKLENERYGCGGKENK